MLPNMIPNPSSVYDHTLMTGKELHIRAKLRTGYLIPNVSLAFEISLCNLNDIDLLTFHLLISVIRI